MGDTHAVPVRIAAEDLRLAVAVIDARSPDPEQECWRLAIVRRFLRAGFELERTLRRQTRCALVHHCGTPGVHSLAAATDQLDSALSDYAARLRELAAAHDALGLESTEGSASSARPTSSRRLVRIV